MGKSFSSKKDYNSVLARQPRKPLAIPGIDTSNNIKQKPLPSLLLIPDPVRLSPVTPRVSEIVSISPNQSSFDTQSVVRPSTSLSQFPVPNPEPPAPPPPPPGPIEPVPVPLAVKHPPLPVVVRKPPVIKSNSSRPRRPMPDDVVIVSRSVVDMTDHRQLKDHQFSLKPDRSIVERNGRQYLTEFRERTEQRHVQWYDSRSGRTRLFEVTDYIPCKIVQPILKNSASHSSIPRTYGSESSPQLKTSISSTAKYMPRSAKRNSVVSRSNSRRNSSNIVVNNSNSTSAYRYVPKSSRPTYQRTVNPPPTTNSRNTMQINSRYSSTPALSTTNFPPQNLSNRYESEMLRSKPSATPSYIPGSSHLSVADQTGFDDDTETEDENMDSDSGSNTAESISNEERTSETMDPFARTTSQPNGGHHYLSRNNANSSFRSRYAQPQTRNGKSTGPTDTNYTPIPKIINMPNRNRYSHLETNIK